MVEKVLLHFGPCFSECVHMHYTHYMWTLDASCSAFFTCFFFPFFFCSFLSSVTLVVVALLWYKWMNLTETYVYTKYENCALFVKLEQEWNAFE